MVYERINWANSPSRVSPLSADNLNRLEDGVEEATTAVRGRLADAALSATMDTRIEESAYLPATFARTLANTAVLFGTSLEAQGGGSYDVTDPAAGTAVNQRGWFHWFNAYTMDSWTLVRNAGIGGNTYAQMRARIAADVLAYASDWVFMGGPTNDIGQGRTSAAIITDLNAMLDALVGRRVLLLNAPPNAGYDSTAKIAVLHEVNRYISAIPTTRANVVVVDCYRILAAPTTSFPATGMAIDGVHYSSAGAILVGKAASEVMAGRYAPTLGRIAAPNDPKGVLANPLATGGAGWSAAGNGVSGASVVAAYNARADGFGYSADITLSSITVDDTYGVEALESIGGGRFAVGDTIWAEATFEWSGVSGLLSVLAQLGPILRLRTRLAAGSFPDEIYATFLPSTERVIPARFPTSGRVRLHTPRITIDATVDRLYLGCFLRGVTGATLKITDANIYKL